MLLRPWRPKSVFGVVVVLVLAGIALYQINEWWPGCNFVRSWYHNEPAGESLIFAAAKAGCTGCVRTLLNHGADPDVSAPLIGAVQYGHYWTAWLLLKRGAHVNAGIGASTALCQALMREDRDNGVVELLLSSGATLQWPGDATQPDFDVFHCLHHSDFGPAPSEETRRFAHLIEHGLVDFFAKLPEGRRAQLILFLYDDEIKQLTQHGAKLNLDVRDGQGKTIFAPRPRVCDRVRLLISEGAEHGPQNASLSTNA